jgi:branched-chain amino acid transport system substrate-binding protein
VSGFGGYAHDAMTLVAEALKASDGDRQKVRDALENIKDHVGVTGRFSFSPEDHNGLTSSAFVMVEIKNQTWNLLTD